MIDLARTPDQDAGMHDLQRGLVRDVARRGHPITDDFF